MRADTQFAVVEATLKGYNKWVYAHGKMPQQDVRYGIAMCLEFAMLIEPRSKSEANWKAYWKGGPPS